MAAAQPNLGPPVGRPLDPATLAAMGVLADWPPPPADFRPDGAWTHVYRLWTCHGYRGGGNADRGWLRLARTPADGGTFALAVRQSVTQNTRVRHVLEARMTCRADALATLDAWTVASRFFSADGSEAADLALRQEGAWRDGRLARRFEGRSLESAAPAPLTSDWGLLEAVQRLADRPAALGPFDVLEGLTVLRPGHRLVGRGAERADLGGRTAELRRVTRLGAGQLPWDYWLDDRGRLVLAASLSLACILDPQAEAKVGGPRPGAGKAKAK